MISFYMLPGASDGFVHPLFRHVNPPHLPLRHCPDLLQIGVYALVAVEARLYLKFRTYVQTGDTFVIRQKGPLEKKLSVFHDETDPSQ